MLAAELADALAGQPAPVPRLPAVRLSEKAGRDAESELTSALLLGDPDRIDVGQLDRVLRLARRHGIDLQPSPLQERLHAFAVAWVDDPSRTWKPEGWVLRDEILDEVYGILHERFTVPLSPWLTQTLNRFCGLFDDRDDLADPLYCHFQAAAIAGLKGHGNRLDRLSVSLGKIARSRDAAAAARVFQEALLAWQADDTDVALTILAQLPSHVDPRIGERANSFLSAAQATPNTELLDMLASLHGSGWRPPTDRLSDLLYGELKVRDFLQAAARADIVSRDRVLAAAGLISDADPIVVQLRAEAVLDALLTTKNPYLTGAVLATYRTTKEGRGKPRPVTTLLDLAAKRMAASPADDSARIAVRLVMALADQAVRRDQGNRWNRVADLLCDYDGRLSARDAKRWRADVRARLTPNSVALRTWDEIFALEPIRQGGVFNLIRKTES